VIKIPTIENRKEDASSKLLNDIVSGSMLVPNMYYRYSLLSRVGFQILVIDRYTRPRESYQQLIKYLPRVQSLKEDIFRKDNIYRKSQY